MEMAAKNKETVILCGSHSASFFFFSFFFWQRNYDIAVNNSKFYDHNDSGYKNETTKARSIHNWYTLGCSRTKVHTAGYAVLSLAELNSRATSVKKIKTKK